MFRIAFDATPHAMVLEQRLRMARRLLESTTMPIAEIAVLTGHADQSSLTRSFRRICGDTPAAIRQRARGGSDKKGGGNAKTQVSR